LFSEVVAGHCLVDDRYLLGIGCVGERKLAAFKQRNSERLEITGPTQSARAARKSLGECAE
jgi:hypothetical protein